MATQFATTVQQPAARHAECEHYIRTHMPLVRKIAWQVRARVSTAIELEDLNQIGMVALIEAARAYEDRGHAFATYATLRIRGAMVDALRRQSAQCRSATAKRRMIEDARSQFAMRNGWMPSDGELATELDVDVAQLRRDALTAQPVQIGSIDDQYSEHDMAFADASDGADVMIDQARQQLQLAAAIRALPEREATVLQLYFVDELSLDEIGTLLGVGAARICQIKKVALEKVRGLLG